MLEPTYRQALARAWHLVWHNKILWIFGLLSVLIGPFGINSFIGNLAVALNRPAARENYSQILKVLVEAKSAPWMAWILVLGLALVVLVVFLAVAAQGALIATVAENLKKKTVPNLEKAWHKGVKHFWRLLFLNILKRAVLGALLLAVAVGFALAPETKAGFAWTIAILSGGLLLGLAIVATGIYSAGYIVEEQRGLWRSILKGGKLFANHFLVSLELSILLVMCDVLVIVGVIIASTLALIPSFVLSIVAGLTSATALITVGIILSSVIFIILAALIGGIYNAFTTSAWIYLFMKMHREGVVSRILHYTRRMMKR
jgi:hypothetical protein